MNFFKTQIDTKSHHVRKKNYTKNGTSCLYVLLLGILGPTSGFLAHGDDSYAKF